MATFKTYAQLAAAPDVLGTDLLASYRGTGPLKSLAVSVLQSYLTTALATSFLLPANNLSDVASVVAARANLAVLGIAANLSDVANATAARANLGALGASDATNLQAFAVAMATAL